VSSAGCPVHDYFVAFRDGVVDSEFEIGKCL
jgi:hypothetical protein